MMLKRRAQEILSLADRTKRDFIGRQEELEGTVAVGSGEFLSTRLLTDCMTAFRRIHPLVKYELYSGNADNISDSIEHGLLDMGLMLDLSMGRLN
jgi:DNA-binding transcriptional LysR family regulator